MSFPTVRGMVMETEEETKRRHIARKSGFFSGFASATTLRKDEAESGEDRKVGRKRARRERVGGGLEAKGRAKACRGRYGTTGRGRRQGGRGARRGDSQCDLGQSNMLAQDICTLAT